MCFTTFSPLHRERDEPAGRMELEDLMANRALLEKIAQDPHGTHEKQQMTHLPSYRQALVTGNGQVLAFTLNPNSNVETLIKPNAPCFFWASSLLKLYSSLIINKQIIFETSGGFWQRKTNGHTGGVQQT